MTHKNGNPEPPSQGSGIGIGTGLTICMDLNLYTKVFGYRQIEMMILNLLDGV